MSKSKIAANKNDNDNKSGSQWGAWINIMLMAWLPILIAALFRHEPINIITKVIADLWFLFTVRSCYSGGVASQLFASPTLAGGVLLNAAVFLSLPHTLNLLLLIAIAGITVSTPNYVRSELDKRD